MVINTFNMKIQEYLKEIEDLQQKEITVDSELENVLLKMASNGEENYFTLETLFQKSVAEVFVLNIETINKIVKHSNLLFSDQNENGNVCFANNNEMRSEFRQSFMITDLLDYCYAILYSSNFEKSLNNKNKRIPIPSDSNLFWEVVKIGTKLRDKL